MNKNETMLPICVYCDATGLFTETECDRVNMIDMFFPAWLIEEWYKKHKEEFAKECKAKGFEPNCYNWYTEVYTADDTIGLYDFAVAKGYDPVFEISDNTQNAVVYENLEYDTVVVFTGTTMECRKWAREHDWKFTIGYGDAKVDLDMLFH